MCECVCVCAYTKLQKSDHFSFLVSQLLPSDFGEFKEWLGALSTEPDHAYLDRIIKTDLIPCLTFKDDKVRQMCTSMASLWH